MSIASNPLAELLIQWLFRTFVPTPPQEKLADRANRVAHIEVSPQGLVGYLNESATFTAVARDAAGEIVQGVKFDWSIDGGKLHIDEAGRVKFTEAGMFSVTCRAVFVTTAAKFLIRAGSRPRQTDEQWKTDQQSVTASSVGEVDQKGLLSSLINNLFPTAYAQGGGSANDIGASAAIDAVGTPPLAMLEPSRLGPIKPRTNFTTGIPIINLGGRNLGTGLNLYYNSNVWGARFDPVQNQTVMTFDPIQSWPSPGFSLGFGRIAYYDYQSQDSSYAYMLIDPDGTRHSLGRGHQSNSNTLKTTDGSNITYVGSVTGGGTLYHKDGTKVTIGFVNNRLLPTQITETNGNYVQIAYQSSAQGFAPMAINHVTDTLGRVIQFNYQGTALASITTTLGTTSLTYQAVNLNTNFQNVGLENTPTSFAAISTVTTPTRPTYNFAYSGYGMANQVSFSGTGATGSVTYNYPTGGEMLYGGPTFSQRTESPTSTFSYTLDSFTGTEIITRPDNSTLRLTPTSWEIKDSSGTSFAKAVYTYTTDPGGSQVVQSITTYDDTGSPTKGDFDYDQYGNVVNVREYGFKNGGAWLVRRRTHNTYRHETGQQYADAYIRDRVTRVEVFDALQNTNDADDVLISKTEFKIDEYGALGGIEGYAGAPVPPGYLSSYDTNYVLRGNVTGSTKWTDIASNTSVTRNSKLDKFGNVVKAEVSCCSQKSFTFGENTYWSKPEQVLSGNPAGINLSSTMVYNFNDGTTASETSPTGQTTSFIYDSAGRPSAYTLPTGAGGITSYNIWGLTSSSSFSYTDGGTNKTLVQSVVYDGWGQVIQTIDTNGAQVNISYDALGRVQSSTNPFPQGATPAPATNYQYDVLGRLKVRTLPDGNTIKYNYSGSSVAITDQVNRKSKREGDGLGRLVKVVEQDATGALAQETTYIYDIADRLIQVNQGGQLRIFKYDSAGRLLYERIPEQTATINDGTGTLWTCKYTYTDFGAVATKTDARGVVTTYGYDSLNRPTSVTFDLTNAPNVQPTNNISYTFDNSPTSSTKGLLLSISMTGSLPTYQETFSYDSQKRLSSRTWSLDGRNYTIGYQYNTANQISQLTYPSGRVVAMGRDNKGRLKSVGSFLTGISYDGIGLRTGFSLGNGVTETFGYDTQRLQLTNQTAMNGGNTLMSLTYNYQAQTGQLGQNTTAGNANQMMSISGTINGTTETANYTYDLLRRVTTSSQTTNGASAQRRFAYDRWGNRTSVWDAVTGGSQIQSITLQQSAGVPTNRITSVTSGMTMNYSYDSSGNVTSDGSHSYSYDSENRLYSVDSGTAGSYRYDYQSRRIKRNTGGVTTHYVWEGSQIIAEYDVTTGAVLCENIYSDNNLIAVLQAGNTKYMIRDNLSTRLILDSSGNVIGRQGHLPFGESIGSTGENDERKFTTYQRDAEGGNDYAVNRRYLYATGRFQSADPFRGSALSSTPQTFNRFSYVDNDPVNFVDPLGLDLDPSNTQTYPGYLICQFFPWLCGFDAIAFPRRGPTREVEGTPGFPLIPTPAAGPRCASRGVGTSGSIDPSIPLTFPDGGRRAGPGSVTIGNIPGVGEVPLAGTFWYVIIAFVVSDDASKWNIVQRISFRGSGSFKQSDGSLVNESTQFSGVETIRNQDKAQIPGHKWLFWVDAPGLITRANHTPWNLNVEIDLESVISQGGVSCSQKWHVKLTYNEGVQTFFRAWSD